jgi:hypothetical protein
MDDEHPMQGECHINLMGKSNSLFGEGGDRGEYKPTTSDWFGRFNLVQNTSNDCLQNYEAIRRGKSYSGIPGVRQQDMAVTETMGPIYKHRQEHLDTTDVIFIRPLARLLRAARAFQEQSILPPGADQPEIYRVRSGERFLPENADWREASGEIRERFGPLAQAAGH